jgi:hypothetical protein
MKALLGVMLAAQLASIAAPAPKKLAIVRMAFAQSEDGVPAASDEHFVPGETIFFRCEVEGYQKTEKAEIHVTYQVDAQDAGGKRLLAAENGIVETTLSPEDKNWSPKIRYTVIVPPLADSGEYQVLVKVKDELANASVEERATFSVKGREVAPSDTLVVRNFRFLRAEEDGKPLQVAAYRPGDAVWARFDMTGYKIAEKNLFDIEYGLEVLSTDGSLAYSQPQAAAAKEQPVYPQRYQPGVLNLNLPNDIAKGEYTIVLTVHDNLGKQVTETREKFSIE